MRALRIASIAIVAALILLGAAVWLTAPSARPGQLLVPANTPFSKGPWFAYAAPWGGESMALARPWAPYADAAIVDLKRFPANTVMHWRWPPLQPSNGPGVWGYDQVSYGNYDGGEPEQSAPPIRVKALTALSQAFRWSLANRWGDGNVLTEFYLRSSTTDVEAKTIEIGWFLHTPPRSRQFFNRSRLIGTYRDAQGRRWTVRMADRFCMFAPEQPGDIPQGSLDMLAALRWLQQKRVITGEEWMWGVAIGVEPVSGIGRFTLQDWRVVRR
ncbi:hypothetical protein [Sphingomonas jatrophae]|uniref:Uncharacterized protein n=1 Tax=Sphingomonas jatrophae TaxID=1166337 RepID=A0A1I6M5L3_9SPHN|nr:hypothetical protein [Sphingomonas jatrophae]SFS11000.1 hypothetical protein SAMN05192580_3505 [Sphingomonas jatrophae]